MNQTTQDKSSKISLLIADLDGTLINREKVLTDRTRDAVRKLNQAGIMFTIITGRPPLGIKMIADQLDITAPLCAFNGGMFLRPNFSIIEQNILENAISKQVVEIIIAHSLDIWLYRGNDWFVQQQHSPYIDRQVWTVKFLPTVVSSFHGLLNNVVKIVGVSDNLEAVTQCKFNIERECGKQVYCQTGTSSGGGKQISDIFSQPCYLDVTHPRANKAAVIDRLCELVSIPANEIASIGDMANDIPMFARSGLSIAMGNASPQVQRQAHYVTTSYQDEGFANAVECHILRDAVKRRIGI